VKKKVFKEIAVTIGWDLEEVTEAMNKLLTEVSIIEDWEQFFRLCVDAKTPEERWERTSSYIYKEIKNNNPVDTICEWLFILDPSFMVCSLFNMAHHVNKRRTSPFWWRALQIQKSFTTKLNPPLLPGSFSDNPLLDPVVLSYELLDRWIRDIDFNENFVIHSIMLNVVEKVGFAAFQIRTFRDTAFYYSLNPLRTPFAQSLTQSLNSLYFNNKQNTERKNWLYYVLVERLMELGFTPMKRAFREASTRLGKEEHPQNTIKTRYHEMKKLLTKIQDKQPSYGIRTIIDEYHLSTFIDQHLDNYRN